MLLRRPGRSATRDMDSRLGLMKEKLVPKQLGVNRQAIERPFRSRTSAPCLVIKA